MISKFKATGIVIAVSSAFAAGYHVSSTRHQNALLQRDASAQMELESLRDSLDNALSELASVRPTIIKETEVVYRDIIKYEPASECDFDDEFISLYNSANGIQNSSGR